MSDQHVYAVAMSGGVDSSTTAAMLQARGHQVFGVTMDIHEHCSAVIEGAASVCRTLGIPHFVLDARVEFQRWVMDVFAEYYAHGMTPNPCAFCNRDIKLSLLLNFAFSKGADLMATGHYVNMSVDGVQVLLREAANPRKDQSYFLSLVARGNLRRVRFPLGNVSDKSETRKMAAEFGLHNFAQKDSQDICFIKEGNYKRFLKEKYPDLGVFENGDIRLLDDGQALGKHDGIVNYTIGQRRGLGVAFNEPFYVIALNAGKNEVIVGNASALDRREFGIFSANWILDMPSEFEATVKLRSLSGKTKARITKNNDGSEAKVELLEPSTTPVTPGQVCAIYDAHSTIIGAGIIEG